jgi:hypothetical protein
MTSSSRQVPVKEACQKACGLESATALGSLGEGELFAICLNRDSQRAANQIRWRDRWRSVGMTKPYSIDLRELAMVRLGAQKNRNSIGE